MRVCVVPARTAAIAAVPAGGGTGCAVGSNRLFHLHQRPVHSPAMTMAGGVAWGSGGGRVIQRIRQRGVVVFMSGDSSGKKLLLGEAVRRL